MKYFSKIDQSKIFPVNENTKIYLKNNNFLNKNFIYEEKIIDEISHYTNLYESKNLFGETWGGTWEWIDKKKRNLLLHSKKKNKLLLKNLFNNFFRNSLSFGLISSHWNLRNRKEWKSKLVSDILKNIIAWEEFTKNSDRDYELLNSKLDIGNPYGLNYKNKLILYDTPRHDYYAKKIINLISQSKNKPIIVEIGGGYGGLVSQLIKRKLKFKYINIDLFKTLPVAYYYLKKNFKINISINDYLDAKGLNKNDFIFIPYFGQNFWKIKKKVHLLFNSNSFSEMGKHTLNKYFMTINKKIKPKYIMHQNTNLHSFNKLKKYKEIPSSKFPIDYKNYSLQNFCLSLFQGGSGRYREFLFKRKN